MRKITTAYPSGYWSFAVRKSCNQHTSRALFKIESLIFLKKVILLPNIKIKIRSDVGYCRLLVRMGENRFPLMNVRVRQFFIVSFGVAPNVHIKNLIRF